MCKHCVSSCVLSTVATWGFFAVLLSVLGVANSYVKAIWLALLALIAVCSCPVMNPKLVQCCSTKKKK